MISKFSVAICEIKRRQILVIGQFRVQYDQYFSYFSDLCHGNEEKIFYIVPCKFPWLVLTKFSLRDWALGYNPIKICDLHNIS